MSRRRRRVPLPEGSHSCRVYWGSHGCRKVWPHLGHHLCEPGCSVPEGETMLYGEDILASTAGEDQRKREELLHARPKENA